MASSSMISANKSNLLGKRKPEPKDKWEKETTQGFSDNLRDVEGGVELPSEADLIPAEEIEEGLGVTPHFVEGVAARKKSLIFDNVSIKTKISDIINFFKDVAKVVNVRRLVTRRGLNLSCGSVQFASANEAKKVQYTKHGEYLHGRKIFLGFAEMTPYPRIPRFCIEHKVWYEDYIRQERFLIKEEEIPPHFFEAIAAREETIFIANLSPQTKMLHIIKFFEDVGKVTSVRLIVNHEGKHVGYGFVEFADAYDAKKALEKKNGIYLHDHKIFLDVARKAPYSPGPKYSLAEKLWFEDYLLRESLRAEDEALEALNETSNFAEAVSVRKKTLVINNLSCQTKISDIIEFFKDVEVVHVRLIVNKTGQHLGYGFVEFASSDKAKEAQQKNGEYLCGNQITLGVAETSSYPPTPMYCIDHKVWYEDYLSEESLLIAEDEAIEEDEAVQGLDEFVEEVSLRKKTLFIDNLPVRRFRIKSKIQDVIDFFLQALGEVSVQLIVDDRGKHVGCGFVKFASAIEAEALEKRKELRGMCSVIFLGVPEMAPYPIRPKYNLAEKLWYEMFKEDFRPERVWIEEGSWRNPFCGKRITFSYDDD